MGSEEFTRNSNPAFSRKRIRSLKWPGRTLDHSGKVFCGCKHNLSQRFRHTHFDVRVASALPHTNHPDTDRKLQIANNVPGVRFDHSQIQSSLPELRETIARRLKCNCDISNWWENFSHESTIKEKDIWALPQQFIQNLKPRRRLSPGRQSPKRGRKPSTSLSKPDWPRRNRGAGRTGRR